MAFADLISSTRHVLERVSAIGAEGHDDPNTAKRLGLTNKIAVTMAVICLPYIGIYAAMGLLRLAVAMPLVASANVVVIALNRTGTPEGFRRARVVMFTNFAVSIGLYAAVLGHGSMTHLAWFAGACLPFLLCDVRERGLIAYGTLAQLGAYAFLELGGRTLLPPPAVGEGIQFVLGAAMVPTSFGMLLMMVGYFAGASQRAEAAMQRRNADMHLVLDNVDQAFMTVNADGEMAQERSAITSRWFGPAAPEQRLWDYLARVDEEAAAYLELGWEELWDGVLPRELVLDQLPARMVDGERTFGLAYRPIERNGALAAVLVVISDLTAEIERERAEAVQRETVEVFQRAMRDRSGFRDFLDETRALLATIEDPQTDATLLARALHTLKGNCGLYGVGSMAACAHRLEDELAESSAPLDGSSLTQLRQTWADAVARLDGLLDEDGPGKVEISIDEHRQLQDAITRGEGPAQLAAIADGWLREPTARPLGRLADQARALARRLGKGEIAVEVHDHGHRVDHDAWRPFWGAMVHVIRNAIDHGLETPEARAAAGKDGAGRLTLATFLEGETFVACVADDGPGVNWEKIRARAQREGLAYERDADLVDALFTDGLSSRDEVTDVSGRGVGLAAARAATEALGGEVSVRAVAGQGTTFEFRVPRTAMLGHAPPAVDASNTSAYPRTQAV